MFGIAALISLISQVSGTPYIPGGDSPAGTDCSGLASWVANVASGRPAFGSRFNTGNMEPALLARGFQYGSAPNSVVIGWNGGHAAVTLPDGTPVSSGESNNGVRVGGGGAYQPQFTHHMFLPLQVQEMTDPAAPAAVEPAPPAEPGMGELPPPAPIQEAGPVLVDAPVPADVLAPADAPAPFGVPPADIPAPMEVLAPADAPVELAPPADAPAGDPLALDPFAVPAPPVPELPPVADPAVLPV